MALDILHDNWGPYTHTEVENALKAYLAVLENRINQAIQSGGVGLADLSTEVQALLNKANTALQPENIAAWAKAQNKPGYTVSEITGVEGFQNLLAKLQDMDAKIQAAAASGGVDPDDEMSSTSVKPVQNKVIKAYVDSLIAGLIDGAPAALDTLKELATALGNNSDAIATIINTLSSKANASEVYSKSQTYNKSEVDAAVADAGKVKSVSINNGTPQQPDAQGNVNLTFSGGGDTDIVGITVPSPNDGTVVFNKRNGDTVTVDLKHVHPQYAYRKTVESNTDTTVTLSADIIYDLGTVAGNKTINLPTTVDQAADYEFRLTYTSGTISGTAISGTTVANNATLSFTAGKTYQVIISGGILYFSETTVS